LVETMTRHSGPALTLALYQPHIPQNCGTMLRLCASLGIDAAIIEPAGFPSSDRAFRRAGMDYLDRVTMLLSTKGARDYCDFHYAPGDILLVGRESAGVPDDVRDAADASVRISIRPPLRSLNVAVAAAMVLGEAIRQIGKEGLKTQ
jgi:tRNA (cytidine/uridine-2'-O-)-methyltransferase